MYLAIFAGLKRVTDEGLVPKIVQYDPFYLPLNILTASKGSNIYILFEKMHIALCPDKRVEAYPNVSGRSGSNQIVNPYRDNRSRTYLFLADRSAMS